MRFRGFRVTELCFNSCFSILFHFSATCLGRTTIFMCKNIYILRIIMTGMRFRSFRLTQLCFNCYSLFYSNSPLQVSVVRPSSCANIYIYIYILQIIMTGMRLRGFRLTQLFFNSCSLFYSNSPLHVSVVRPSASANIYITNYHDWRGVQVFPSNATLLQ
jgi:hypothetical protein